MIHTSHDTLAQRSYDTSFIAQRPAARLHNSVCAAVSESSFSPGTDSGASSDLSSAPACAVRPRPPQQEAKTRGTKEWLVSASSSCTDAAYSCDSIEACIRQHDVHCDQADRFFEYILGADHSEGRRRDLRVGLSAHADAHAAPRPLFSQTVAAFAACVARNICRIEKSGDDAGLEKYVAYTGAVMTLWLKRIAELMAHPERRAYMPTPEHAGSRFMVSISRAQIEPFCDVVDLFPYDPMVARMAASSLCTNGIRLVLAGLLHQSARTLFHLADQLGMRSASHPYSCIETRNVVWLAQAQAAAALRFEADVMMGL